jgi:cyclopropane fatty-acyl-phospholipid synthase-like methyltransferase
MTFEDIYQMLLKQAPEEWSLQAGDTVLDLGCGTGWYARRLSLDERCRGTRIVGLDISQNALEVAREKQSQVAGGMVARVEYHAVDLLEKIPGDPAREIWFCGAWHQTSDPPKSLARVAEVLADDGVLFVQTYRVDPDANQAVDVAVMGLVGHHVFKKGEIESIAEGVGLKIMNRQQKGMIELCTMIRV